MLTGNTQGDARGNAISKTAKNATALLVGADICDPTREHLCPSVRVPGSIKPKQLEQGLIEPRQGGFYRLGTDFYRPGTEFYTLVQSFICLTFIVAVPLAC